MTSESQCISNLDIIFNNYSASNNHRSNNNSKYYSFYLPSDVQELEFYDTYHHLIFNSSDFVMNLNINAILCERVFNTSFDDPFSFLSGYVIYEHDNLSSNDENKYKFCLYNVYDKYYFSLFTNKFDYFGTTSTNEVDLLLSHLFTINDSAKLDYKGIIDSYYLGTTIEYTQSELELFDKYFPPEGTVDSLLHPEDKNTNQGSEGSEFGETDEGMSSETGEELPQALQ